MRKLLSAMSLALMVGFLPAMAEAATCTQTGKLVRVKYRDNDSPGFHIVYLRSGTAFGTIYTARTTDDGFAALAGNMVSSQTRVKLTTAAANCSPSGTIRFIGQAKILEVVP